MKIELEFLDMSKTRLHEDVMIYEDIVPPIPNVDEGILMEGSKYIVKERDFIYLSGRQEIDLKVSFWCEALQAQ